MLVSTVFSQFFLLCFSLKVPSGREQKAHPVVNWPTQSNSNPICASTPAPAGCACKITVVSVITPLERKKNKEDGRVQRKKTSENFLKVSFDWISIFSVQYNMWIIGRGLCSWHCAWVTTGRAYISLVFVFVQDEKKRCLKVSFPLVFFLCVVLVFFSLLELVIASVPLF